MRGAFYSGDLIGTLELTDSGRRDFLNPKLLLDLTSVRHRQMDQHLPITRHGQFHAGLITPGRDFFCFGEYRSHAGVRHGSFQLDAGPGDWLL